MRRKITQFGEPLGDQPRDAALSTQTLQHGDLIIYATDGVWDNLDNGEILRLVVKASREAGVLTKDKLSDRQLALATRDGEEMAKDKLGHNLQAAIATSIVNAAKVAGLDEQRDGPFARAVQKAYPGERYHGGKPDDVCVIVMVALEEGRARSAKL
jgi:protein phosphatase PTC7